MQFLPAQAELRGSAGIDPPLPDLLSHQGQAALGAGGLRRIFHPPGRCCERRGNPVLEHLVDDHRQVVGDELAENLVYLGHGIPGPDVLPELSLKG